MLHPQGHSEGKDIQNYQLDEQKPKEMDRNLNWTEIVWRKNGKNTGVSYFFLTYYLGFLTKNVRFGVKSTRKYSSNLYINAKFTADLPQKWIWNFKAV